MAFESYDDIESTELPWNAEAMIGFEEGELSAALERISDDPRLEGNPEAEAIMQTAIEKLESLSLATVMAVSSEEDEEALSESIDAVV
jgi:hypothetical protein